MTGVTTDVGASLAPMPVSGHSEFLEEYKTHPQTVDPYNTVDAKRLIDDAVANYLVTDAGYEQDTCYTDVRMLLNWLSVVFAAYSSIYSNLIDFHTSQTVLFVGVVGYFVCQGVNTLLAMLAPSDVIFLGHRLAEPQPASTEARDADGLPAPPLATPTDPRRPHMVARLEHQRYGSEIAIQLTTCAGVTFLGAPVRGPRDATPVSVRVVIPVGELFHADGLFVASTLAAYMNGMLHALTAKSD
ncbi:hypothetical protein CAUPRSCDRAFT_12133 [Caulochytrium protostelioides]|uniref:Signal peptidase complex subunit 2 n=1 Tax=Caulochytrium protostelioides TaxID=1555241 RepID=A0A4P9WUM1_9FUNG|nr:hypothetical protein CAUPRSCDRAFT_12133 [Caulochytrium protostelioides]